MSTDSESWETKLQQGLLGKLKAPFRWGTSGKLVRAAQFMDQADLWGATTPDRAVKLYTQAIDLLAKIQGMDEVCHQFLGAALLRRGRLLEEVGEDEEALKSYLLSRDFFPTLPDPVVDFITFQFARKGLSNDEALGFYLDFLKAHRGDRPGPEAREVSKHLKKLSAVSESDRGKKALERLTLNKKILKVDPTLEWAHYHAGMACFLLKKYEDATFYFRKASELRSRHPHLAFFLAFSRGLYMVQKDQWQPAVESLREATRENPQIAEAFQALGAALIKLAAQSPGESQERVEWLREATDSLEQAFALTPQNADYAFQWGKALLLTGDRAAAIHAFREAVQLAPHRSAYFLDLGLALKQSGALAEAREAAQKGLDLTKASYPDPESLEALHRLLGEICLEMGEFEAAAFEFQQVLAHLPEDPKARHDLGAALFGLNRWADAVPILEPVALGSPPAMFHLARCLALTERHDQAVQWLERLTDLEPHNSQAFYFLGLAYAHLGRFSEAAVALDQSIAQNGAQPDSFLQRANVMMKMGQAEAARSDYQQALSLAPDDPDILFHLGCFSRQIGDEEGASVHLSRAVQQNPQHLSAYLVLGELYEKAGRFPEALQAYETAATLAPQDLVILRRLGVLHFRQGNLDAAIERLQQSAQLGDDSDELAYYQGQVALTRQEWDAALEAWRRIQQRHPEDASVSLNLGNLHYLQGRRHLEAGRLPEAIREWQICTELLPGDETVRRDLATLHFRLALQELIDGSPTAMAVAQTALEQAHGLDADNPQYPYYLALCRLVENRDEDFQGAVEPLMPHLDTRTRLHARYHQAIFWLTQGDGEKAATLLKELQPQVEQEGLGLDVHLPLALIQAQAGHWQEAVSLLSAAPASEA